MAVGNPPSLYILRYSIHRDPVPLQDSDVILAHLPAHVGEHLVAVLELHAEGSVGQHLAHGAHHLYGVAGHRSSVAPFVQVGLTRGPRAGPSSGRAAAPDRARYTTRAGRSYGT